MIISQKEQKIISILIEKGRFQLSAVHEEMAKRGEDVSLVAVKKECFLT